MNEPTSKPFAEDVSVTTKKQWLSSYGRHWKVVLLCMVVLDIGVSISIGEWARISMLYGLYAIASVLVIHARVQKEFMRAFARASGFQFAARGSSEHRKGKLFAHEHTNNTTNVVSGVYLGNTFELFNYQYSIRSGKNTVTHEATVMQIAFNGPVPQFSLIERTDSLGMISRLALGQRVHELEGDFHKYFLVQVREGHEIEMLEILTPEVMAFLVDNGCKLSFEFVGRMLYVYEDSSIGKGKELQAFFDLTHLLVERLEHRIGRLHDDVAAVYATQNKKST